MPPRQHELWLSDELWQEIRPQRPRHSIAATVSVIFVLVAGLAAWWAGAFSSHVITETDQATFGGHRLVLAVMLQDGAPLPYRVTGLSGNQPGARLLAAQLTTPASLSASAPLPTSGTKIRSFMVRPGPGRHIVLYYDIDCMLVRAPLRLDVHTRGPLWPQTRTVALEQTTSDVLRSLCGPVRHVP